MRAARAGLLPLLFFLALPGCGSRGAADSRPRLPRERPVAPLFESALTEVMLEEPGRDRWQQPERIVRALGLKPGQSVADIGAGSGYLLPHLSRAVGPEGTVYAEEIQEAFGPRLRKRAESLKNVRVVLGTADDPKLPPETIDCFVLLTTYHEVERPVEFLRTLHRCARPAARLTIIDFDRSRSGDPPAPAEHEVWEQDVVAEAGTAGWRLEERHEFLGSQFFLVFER